MRLAAASFFLLLIFSCTKVKQEEVLQRPAGCVSTRFTFDRDILPILNANCNFHECHAPAGEGSYDFTRYSVIADRIRAGSVEYRIELPLEDPQHMPQDFNLSICDYYRLKSWIIQGYPKN